MEEDRINSTAVDCVAGVDEAGRGAIAGPVVAAAVVLDVENYSYEFKDSKKISSAKRSDFYKVLKSSQADIGLGIATPREIETFNIHKATLLAMERALKKLKVRPLEVKVDGIFCPKFEGLISAIPKGDQHVQPISAASIVAKVFRDYLMLRLDRLFPKYEFALHKGYPTKSHKHAIKKYGVISSHRMSFEPIRSQLKRNKL